jgi:deazaflavin-dependent oxidoreductase (nitroreductase family)
MAHKAKTLPHPSGLLAWLFRLPIWFYQIGLGALLGGRFVLIHHIGRKTGLPRQAVVEVVHHHRDSDTYLVCAAYGPHTQWYQNLVAHPEVRIQVGRRKMVARAEALSPQAGAQEWVEFTRRTGAGRIYARFLGYEVDGTQEDFRQMGEMMLFVALHVLNERTDTKNASKEA